MSDSVSELAGAFRCIWENIHITAPSVAQWGSLALDGRSLPPEFDSVGRPLSPLVNALRMLIYQSVYTQGVRRALAGGPFTNAPDAATPDLDFTDRLVEANAGLERWEHGWVVETLTPHGELRVRKEHRVRRAAAGEYALHRGPGLSAREGEAVSLHVLPESQWLQPGYYHAIGDTLAAEDELAEIVRLYFAVRASGAVELLRSISKRLNRYGVPFQAKFPTLPSAYRRLDAAVLYVARRDYPLVAQLLAEVSLALQAELEEEVPLCAKRLARGVGLAEEPLTGESFGLHRSRLIAEAVLCARQRGVVAVDAGWQILRNHFAERGHDIARPWLNPGSLDTYAPLELQDLV